MTKDAAEGSRSTRFQPGQSGNPDGRLKDARNKLKEAFITDLYDAWQKHGADVIRRCVEENPAEVHRVARGVCPEIRRTWQRSSLISITTPERGQMWTF